MLFPAISFAQERLEKGDDKFRYMVNELNLTAEQIALVRPIIEEYETKRQELRQALNDQMVSDNRVILSKMEKLREEVSQKLRQALTPEQLEKWNSKQRIHNLLNKDQSGDSGWAPRGSGNGLGAEF